MNINSIPKIFTHLDATKFHPRDYPNTGNPNQPLNSALSSTLFSLSLSPPSLLTFILRYDPHISPHIFALPKIRRLPKFLFFPSPPFLHSISRNFKARRDNPAVRSLLILSILLFFLPFLPSPSLSAFKLVQRWAKVRISAENANFPSPGEKLYRWHIFEKFTIVP